MEDRQAPRFRPLGQGIPAQPIDGIPMDVSERPLEDGIVQGPESVDGIYAGPGYTPPRETPGPAKCGSKTKKGDPCKAYATSGGKLCVGHGG